MKTKYKLAIALVAGAAIGGAVVQGLHAQTKPRAYAIVENIVTDKEAYAKTFFPGIGKILTGAGGKFLARGGTIVTIRGEAPKSNTVIEVIEFGTLEKAEATYFSPVWNDARKIGDVYSTARIFIVDGVAQ